MLIYDQIFIFSAAVGASLQAIILYFNHLAFQLITCCTSHKCNMHKQRNKSICLLCLLIFKKNALIQFTPHFYCDSLIECFWGSAKSEMEQTLQAIKSVMSAGAGLISGMSTFLLLLTGLFNWEQLLRSCFSSTVFPSVGLTIRKDVWIYTEKVTVLRSKQRESPWQNPFTVF